MPQDLYGAAEGTRLIWIFYVAPERHYFERDLPTFEHVAGTLRIRGAATAPPSTSPSS